MDRLYPQAVVNNNVPDNVYLVADLSQMGGEIHITYYIDQTGSMFKVCDWVDSKPQSVAIYELCRITGDSENMINSRWSSYFYWKNR